MKRPPKWELKALEIVKRKPQYNGNSNQGVHIFRRSRRGHHWDFTSGGAFAGLRRVYANCSRWQHLFGPSRQVDQECTLGGNSWGLIDWFYEVVRIEVKSQGSMAAQTVMGRDSLCSGQGGGVWRRGNPHCTLAFSVKR